MRNREGMTWSEWRNAVGVHGGLQSRLREAWIAGEDPTEWRAHLDTLRHMILEVLQSHTREQWYDELSKLPLQRKGLPMRLTAYNAIIRTQEKPETDLPAIAEIVLYQCITDGQI